MRTEPQKIQSRVQSAVLAHLLKGLISERFKRMAKDEVLFKFLADRFDPAVLIDHALLAEKEALELTEMSLLKLVASDMLLKELQKAAEKIERSLRDLSRGSILESHSLIEARIAWLDARVQFYKRWLSVQVADESGAQPRVSPTDLAQAAFKSFENFEKSLKSLIEADAILAEEMVKATIALHRFMVRKQMDYELRYAHELWEEFAEEAFKKPAQLP